MQQKYLVSNWTWQGSCSSRFDQVQVMSCFTLKTTKLKFANSN